MQQERTSEQRKVDRFLVAMWVGLGVTFLGLLVGIAAIVIGTFV